MQMSRVVVASVLHLVESCAQKEPRETNPSGKAERPGAWRTRRTRWT